MSRHSIFNQNTAYYESKWNDTDKKPQRSSDPDPRKRFEGILFFQTVYIMGGGCTKNEMMTSPTGL